MYGILYVIMFPHIDHDKATRDVGVDICIYIYIFIFRYIKPSHGSSLDRASERKPRMKMEILIGKNLMVPSYKI